MKKLYYWLFNNEERAHVTLVEMFFYSILVSIGVCLFILGVTGVYTLGVML